MFKKFQNKPWRLLRNVSLENIILNIIQSGAKRNLILITTLIAFILSILMIAPSKMVLAKMLPGKNSDTFTIYTTLTEGSSIQQTKKVTNCVLSLIQKEKDVTDLEVFLGMGSPLDFAGLVKGSHFKNSENVAEIVINLSEKHHRSEPSYLMVQRVRPIIQKNCTSIYKNTTITFVEPPAGPPVLAAIVAEIYGSDANEIGRASCRERVSSHV